MTAAAAAVALIVAVAQAAEDECASDTEREGDS